MADTNTTEHVVKITADTSSVDQSLERSEQNMSKFEAFAKKLGSYFTNTWNKMATSIDDSTHSLDNFGEELDKIDTGFNDFTMNNVQKEIERTTKKLDNLIARRDKMHYLGGDAASNSFKSLQYDITATREKLYDLNTTVSGELERGIEHVRSEMERISKTKTPTEGYKQLQDAAEKSGQALEKLLNKQDEMQAIGVNENSAAWRRLQYQIDITDESLARYERQMKQMEARGTAYTQGVDSTEYAQAQAQLADYEKRLEQAQQATEEYVKGSEKDYTAALNSVIKISKKVATSVTNNIGKSIKNSFKSAGDVVKSLLRKFTDLQKSTNSVKKSVDKFAKSFTSTFTRLFLRLKEFAITSLFNDMRSSFGLVVKSSERFNAAVSSVIDSMKALGAQIVAIIEPVVSILGPMISNIIDRMVSAADAAAQFTARITGNDTYLKANKGQSDYAKSLDKTTSKTNKATNATNALKRSLLGFDQIHKLDDNTVGIDTASLEKATTEATAFNDIADSIREAIVSGNFGKFGKIIADVVNSSFGWLDKTLGWSKNAEKFTKIIKNVVDSINGFVSGLDAKTIGRSIGNVINTIGESIKRFTDPNTGIDFANAGAALGETLLETFTSINWNAIGKAVMQSLQGGINFVNGLLCAKIVSGVTGEEVTIGKAIGQSLNSAFESAISAIDPKSWGDIISNVVNNITGLITGLFGDTSNVIELATKIGESINSAIENINAEQLAEAITSLVNTFIDFFDTLFKTIDWGEVWDLLTNTLSSMNVDWLKLVEAIGIAALPSIIVGTITSGLSGLGSVIAQAAATVASSPVVLTAAATAFGVSGAIYGVKAAAERAPALVEETKDVLYGDNDYSLKALDDLGAEFDNFGGALGAAVSTYFDMNKVIEDANGEFVAFRGNIISAQDFVDKTAGKTGMFGENLVTVTEDMKELREKLIAQGSATDNSAEKMSTKLDPALDGASSALTSFGSQLDSLNRRMSSYADDVTSFIKTDYGTKTYSIPKFASGGTVGDGQLFIANENGAELIGRGDNGNTAIVNNEQIISAIVSGVKAAVTEAGVFIADRVANQSGSGDIVIEVDSIELARATSKGQRKIDRRGNHNVTFA